MALISKVFRKISNLLYIKRNLESKRKVDLIRKDRKEFTYHENPNITLIIQFFNKRQNITQIMESVRRTSAEEIIIIDDGSADGSYEDWLKYLTRPNDFLLRCNDIFEIRTYDRAINMARGEYICLLQDDDIPPPNNTWIEEAIKLFETFPNLLILGGRQGLELLTPDPIELNGDPKYQKIGNLAGSPGIAKYRVYDRPLYTEPKSGIPFMFTMVVNRAPTILRREAFLKIGGINQEYAPFQCDDVDACLRAWLAGYQVGLYTCPFSRDVGRGGMRVFNSEKVPAQATKNWQKIYATYSLNIADGSLENLVQNANKYFTA
ncbi:glycosyltransferase family 2 protein [Argonema galeatum]|uniref:glycosyltransferase family 2 protein n=1 Tax=Argonema galeatum TaxID=2942762 RepID=UPI0023DF88F7|nr:glycosyltransferase [Argonema galeatum]MCL1467698.1 glycosyltransferase [Argonema galeatum A003/A1]